MPNKEQKDVHTEHCCTFHGCKYGEDREEIMEDGTVYIECSVVSGRKKQSHPCQICMEDEMGF